MSTSSSHTFVSNIILQQKEPGTLRKMADSMAVLRIYKMSLEHVAILKSGKCPPQKKIKWGYVKGTQEPIKGASNGKARMILAEK